ncbi:MAG: cation transporter, partial [Candidatus Thorarchaeota archaeon]
VEGETLEEVFSFSEGEIRSTEHARKLAKTFRVNPAETILYAVLCAVFEGITTRIALYSHLDSMFVMRLRRMNISPIDVDESIQHGLNEGLLSESNGQLTITSRGKWMLREGRRAIMHEGYWMMRFLTERNVVTISGMCLVFLVIFKVWIGSLVGSHALLTDGLENLTDLVVVGIIALSLKYERDRLGAICIMVFMMLSGSMLGYSAVMNLISPTIVETSYWAYIVPVFSIAVNFMLIWYKTTVGRMTGNLALVSDAKEDGTHIRIAYGVLIGLLFAEFGISIVDSIVALLISVVIVLEGVEALRELVEAGDDLSVDTIHLAAADQYEDMITNWMLAQLARGPKSPKHLNGKFLQGVSLGFRYFDVHAIIGFNDLESKGIWKHLQIAKRSGIIEERDGALSITENGFIQYYKNRVDELKEMVKRFSKSRSKWTAVAYSILGWTVFILFVLYGESAYNWLMVTIHALLPIP